MEDPHVNALHSAFVRDTIELMLITANEDLNTSVSLAWSKSNQYIPPRTAALTHSFIQNGNDFGERFQDALVRSLTHSKNSYGVIIIGSDCPTLNLEILNTAIKAVRGGKPVIGPATKNGFYLLGVPTPTLKNCDFSKDFRTANAEYQAVLKTLGSSNTHILPELYDIDEYKDYVRLRNDVRSGSVKIGTHTSSVLSTTTA